MSLLTDRDRARAPSLLRNNYAGGPTKSEHACATSSGEVNEHRALSCAFLFLLFFTLHNKMLTEQSRKVIFPEYASDEGK